MFKQLIIIICARCEEARSYSYLSASIKTMIAVLAPVLELSRKLLSNSKKSCNPAFLAVSLRNEKPAPPPSSARDNISTDRGPNHHKICRTSG